MDLESPGDCRHLITALHYQRPLIEKEMERQLEASDNFITRKIPDKGVTTQFEIDDDIEFGVARQPFAAYRSIAAGPPDKVTGNMPARLCDGTRGNIETLVDPFNPNACHGFRTWNFAHGYAVKTSQDFEDAYMSDVICIENYAKFGPSRVKGLFSALRREFPKHGVENYEANLRKLVIQNGESNFSLVGSATHFQPTTNGWEAPPSRLLDIPWFEQMRRYALGLEKSRLRTERDVLEIEVDRRSWFAAVQDDIIRTGGPQVALQAQYYTDPRAPFYGRAFHEYKNIRAVFNDEPMRGYFKPVGISGGNTLYEFVEVLPWINVAGADLPGATEGAGVLTMKNPDYWRDTTVCDGVTYQIVNLGWYLSPDAFERKRIAPTMAPAGVNPMGTNFEVKLITGAFIDCNEKENKFRLAAQHKFRLKVKEPQLAGAFVYIGEPLDIGYIRLPCNNTEEDTAPTNPSSYDGLAPRQPDACEMATCVACVEGTVADATGACVETEDGLFELEPCGQAGFPVEVVWESGTLNVVLKVWRTGDITASATVDYAVTGGTAVAGTHFTDPADATLSWAAGEGGYQTITVPVIGADAADPKTFTVTISNATGGSSIGDCSASLIEIQPTG